MAREWWLAHRSLLLTMSEFPPVPGQLDLLQVLGTPTEAADPPIDQPLAKRQPNP